MSLKICLIVTASLSLVVCMRISKREPNIRDNAVYLMQMVEEYKQYKTELQNAESSCSCVNYTCICCVNLVIEKISLNETGCVNVSYLPDEYGIEFVFTLNGRILIDDKISVKNPPPICAAIPYIHQLASLCLRFYNLDYQKQQFSGCADIEVRLEAIIVEKYDLGCFHIPPSQRSILKAISLTGLKNVV